MLGEFEAEAKANHPDCKSPPLVDGHDGSTEVEPPGDVATVLERAWHEVHDGSDLVRRLASMELWRRANKGRTLVLQRVAFDGTDGEAARVEVVEPMLFSSAVSCVLFMVFRG